MLVGARVELVHVLAGVLFPPLGEDRAVAELASVDVLEAEQHDTVAAAAPLDDLDQPLADRVDSVRCEYIDLDPSGVQPGGFVAEVEETED